MRGDGRAWLQDISQDQLTRAADLSLDESVQVTEIV